MNTPAPLNGIDALPAVLHASVQEFLMLADAPVPAGRQLQRIVKFWFETRMRHGAPSRSHFRPEELVAVLPDLFIIDLLPSGDQRYRLAGTRLAHNFPCDPTTLLVGDFSGSWADMILQPLSELTADRLVPHLFLAYAAANLSEKPIAAAVGLPLFDDNGDANMIIGAAVFGSSTIMRAASPDRVAKVELLP